MSETTTIDHCEALFESIKNKTAKVGVIGLGYVGIVTIPVVLLIVNWNQLATWTSQAASQLFG